MYIENLKNDNCDDFEKIFSIIELGDLKFEDYKILLRHLVNHSNPIREAVAYKLETVKNSFFDDEVGDILTKSLTDINPNVARSICSMLNNNPDVAHLIEDRIISKINECLDELGKEKFENNKSHAKNKKLFSLYWLLEGLFYCKTKSKENEIIKILNTTIRFSDYTIREKTAKILASLDNPPKELMDIISKDENFYVNFYIKKTGL